MFISRATVIVETTGKTSQQSQLLQNSGDQQLLTSASSRKENKKQITETKKKDFFQWETMPQYRVLLKKLDRTPEDSRKHLSTVIKRRNDVIGNPYWLSLQLVLRLPYN
jgi:hypothetical protein